MPLGGEGLNVAAAVTEQRSGGRSGSPHSRPWVFLVLEGHVAYIKFTHSGQRSICMPFIS